MSALDPFEGVEGLIFYASRQHNGYSFSMNMTSVKRVRSLKSRGVLPNMLFVTWDSSKPFPADVSAFFAGLTDAQREGLVLLLTGMNGRRRRAAGGVKFVEVVNGAYGPIVEYTEPADE